ncbi:kinase-like protein [Paxillus ammoniavirescens]|nr:kinase-like protein [Paxillus ammoniavirescens]
MALMNVQLKDLTGTIHKTGDHPFDHGNHADIWLGVPKDPKQIPRQVAIKVIRSIFTAADVQQLNDKLLREARLWTTLKHANIVPFLGITTDMGLNLAPSLVAPYYKHGSLNGYVTSNNLTHSNQMDLLCQFASGLAYLHTCKIVHGDIKPGNILIDDNGRVVLSDFGLSRVLEVSGFTTGHTPGTLRYMAPELLGSEPAPGTTSGAIRTTIAADVWAFAVTATEIFSTKKPYHDYHNDAAVLVYVYRNNGTLKYDDYKSDIREGVWSGLVKCWQQDPGKRPSMDQMNRFLQDKRDKYARSQ